MKTAFTVLLFSLFYTENVYGVNLPLCTNELKRAFGDDVPCIPHGSERACQRLADVAFILDTSRSIGQRSFGKEKAFVQKILGAFEVGPDSSRIAAVSFSDSVVSEFNFNSHTTADEVLSAVNGIPYASGMATLTYSALEYTHDNVFTKANGDRDDVADIVVLVTDGGTNPGRVDTSKTQEEGKSETIRQAERLKSLGVSVFTIGVGNYIDPDELRAVASEPTDKYYLKVASYDELNTDAIVDKITTLTCEDLEPEPPICPRTRLMETGSARVKRQSADSGSQQVCEGKPADVLFILDQSTSLSSEQNFQKELDFVNGIVNYMDFDQTKISVIKFSDDATLEIKFDQYSTKSALSDAVSSITWDRGNTYTNEALDLLIKQGFTAANGARDGVDKIGIIITDGGSTEPTQTESMAKQVQSAGITMFAIGVGPEFYAGKRDNIEELNKIASDPDSDFVFTVDDVDALQSVVEVVAKRVCRDICPTPPVIDCDDLPADIVFLLDKSTSLNSQENFNKELLFVSDLVSTFDIGPDHTRCGAISFSTNAQVEFDLDTYGSRQQIQNAIASINYTRGDTYMDKAVHLMMVEEFSGKHGDRPDAKKVAIVLTDGAATNPTALKKEVADAKAAGIKIFAIGIGDDIHPEELREIASEPAEYFVFEVASLDTLSEIRLKLGLRVCNQLME